MITITEPAAKRIQDMLQAKGLADGFFRIKVLPGGCSGLSYDFELTREKKPDDMLIEQNGARVLIDPKTDFFIGDSRFDFIKTLAKTGFVVQNPNASSSCGCGQSFSV